LERLSRARPGDAEVRLDLAKCYNSRAMLLAADGGAEAALAAYRQAIDVQRGAIEGRNGGADSVRALAETYSNLGLLQGQLGQKDEARTSLLATIGLLDMLAGREPQDPRRRHDLAIGYNNLSFVERDSDWAEAEKSCQEAIEILQKLQSEQEEELAYRSDLALCFNNLGAILGHRKAWESACQAYREAIGLGEQLTRQASSVVQYRRDLAVSWNNLGQAYDSMHNATEATKAFDAADAIASLLAKDYPNELTIRSLCGAIQNNREMVLEASGQLEAALKAYVQAVEHQRFAAQRAPQVAEYRESLSKHYYNYGRALRAAGQPERAGEIALERRKLWPGQGEHLGQVAAELAQATLALRENGATDAEWKKADELESEMGATLRAAAAAGCDVEKLRRSEPFALLQNDAIWGTLKKQ
jgi:tetratricopeptide (TPR) repeat protein